MEIYCVCGMGMGSSLIAKMNVEELLAKEGIEATVNYCDIGSVTGKDADYYILTRELADNMPEQLKEKVIIVSNFISIEQMKKPILDKIKVH